MMKSTRENKARFPTDQLLGITLIGLLLLSALIYYKSVKAQRYLEPSLAISAPRIALAQQISNLISEQFGSEKNKGVFFTANSILVDDRLIFTDTYNKDSVQPDSIKKLSYIFLSMLNDNEMRTQIDLILVSTRLPSSPHFVLNKRKQMEKQNNVKLVLNSLLGIAPELKNFYSHYFASSVISVRPDQNENWIEFRFIPTEHLHIDVIESLKKYTS